MSSIEFGGNIVNVFIEESSSSLLAEYKGQ